MSRSKSEIGSQIFSNSYVLVNFYTIECPTIIVFECFTIHERHLVKQAPHVGIETGTQMYHYFWQASDSVCTTVLTVTLSRKKNRGFFC